MPLIVNALLIGAAGALGTLLRAGCTTLATRLLGPGFPWGTVFVNVVGSFAFGIIFALARTRALPTEQEVVLLVGLLVGCTATRSTVHLVKAEQALLLAREAHVAAPRRICHHHDAAHPTREWGQAGAERGAAEHDAGATSHRTDER